MILVTGGTGLLGSHVLMRLVEDGLQVRAIYRTEKRRDAVKKVFGYYTAQPETIFQKIEWVEADVLDVSQLQKALEGVTQVYHCAAAVSFIPAEEPHMHKVNVEGTANMVNLCLERPGIRLCHVSSVAAIGRDGTDTVITEKNEWKSGKYNAAYAVSKHHAEMELWRGITEGLNAFMVNPSLIIGPGDWNQSTGAMFSKVWQGLPFYTPGGNCFVDVRDVTDAMVALMQTEVRNERFIVGAENRLFKDVFTRIAEGLGKKPPSILASPWMAELTWRVEKVRTTILGKKPFITKETAHHAMQLNRYDNSKLLAALPDFRFREMNESLKFVCEKFMTDQTVPS